MDGNRGHHRWMTLLLLALTGCAADSVARRNLSDAPEQFIARATDGRLDSLREESRSDEPTTWSLPKRSSSSSNHCHDDGDDDSGLAEMFGALILSGLSSPFTLPCLVIGDEYDHAGTFPPYPYHGGDSAMLMGRESEGTDRSWMGNLQLISVESWDDVRRYSGRLQLDTSSRFGLDIESNRWLERLSGGGRDELWTGDANVVFRFAQSETWQFRAGAGVNWLADDLGTELGYNLTYGADWFPRKPWTVSSNFDFGRIGDAGMFHNRTTVGAMWGPSEIFCGYDYFQLGSTSLHGPVAGIGLRF